MTIHNTSKILDEKITTWKNKLIDLSRRNRLLNFRSTKATTIKIVDEIPSEVFKSLVINSDSFHFLPKEEKGLFNQSESESTEEPKVDSYPHDLQRLEDQHTDDNLQTNLTEQRLQKNLKRIHFRANQLMEEQGYNILYLTLAMLQWHEADHSDLINKSPLIMVPVELHRKSIKSKYKLYRTEEDPFINPALQHKLSYEFDLNLPDLEEEIDPQEYLSKIMGLIENNTRWKVTFEIYLGLFSFAKFVMFKDLDKYSDVFKNNKIIQALAGVLESKQTGGVEDYITAAELDEKRKPLDLFQVLDADSSQQEAIEAVKSGRSIVIQGPPGTGKSQTITNLIAEALTLGKKVLFVSEKMAALDVVYRRLQSVGIGDYCLEIHSRKANKRYVLDQLKDAYEAKHPGNPIFQSQIDELLTSKKKLTDYSSALHSPVEPFGKSPYWIFGQLNQMRDAEILNLKVSNYTNVSFNQYQAAINILDSVRRRIEEIGPPTDHPFWGCLVEDSPSRYEHQGLIKQFKILSNRLAELSNLLNDFSAQIGININTLSLASSYCKLLTILSEDHTIPESLGAIYNAAQYFEELQPTLSDIEKYQEQREKIRREYDENIFSENISQIHDLLTNRFKSFWRIFVPEYYKLKKVIKPHAYEKISFSYSKLLTDVGEIFSNIKFGEEIELSSKEISRPLGSLWNGLDTSTDIVSVALKWLIQYQKSRVSSNDDKKFFEYILNSVSIPGDLPEFKTTIEAKIRELKEKFRSLDISLKVDPEAVYPLGFDDTPIDELFPTVNKWHRNIDLLVDWTRYQRVYNKCKKVGFGKYLDGMLVQEFKPEELVTTFKKLFLSHLVQYILDQSPILKEFEALTQNQIVKKFQRLDKYQLELAKLRTTERLFKQKPDANWEGSKLSELGYLQKQFRLKRGHHPIRKIFVNVPNVVQKLCPCFMMSPLSLSQYIDPAVMKFDIVVFDEASQISPADSLGAIIRGNQGVIVGDTKQLPPTTFFESIVQTIEDDEHIDDLSTPDLESILDECLTIGLKEFTLKWHYRSRDESLIHFSNKSFYRNKLRTFPSPNRDPEHFGLSLVHIKDSEYDRGGSGKNRKEAQEVAEAVFKHFKINPEKSLGVGAFSQAQQIAILDEIELSRRQDPSLESFFAGSPNEPFFVKNLETIQGDERDTIFISIGYGRDPTGKLSMNFGPLNREGGERRLNVLVTRAREKVVVFSSILGDDFDLSKTQATGVHRLKEYLDFAKSHGDRSILDKTLDLSNEFDESNVFERSVYEQLTAEGIKAVPQVGYAGYKIDFGILHPDEPSKFILAIECDGANYHSSATARDRDRLRQQILENLGWRFHRIWSTDWFLNPSREMKRLLQAIEEAKNNPVNVPTNLESPKVGIEKAEPENTNNNFGVEIVPYEKYPVTELLGPPADFYWQIESYDYSDGYHGDRIENLIISIVKTESPIHIKELSLRVIQHFSMGRVGSRIEELMKSLVAHLDKNNRVVFKNDFVSDPNVSFNKIRTRDIPEAVTNIEFISPEEIQNAIILVVKKEISISRDELIPKTARVFGFHHTGKKIQEYIENQITQLLLKKKIVKSDFGLQCTE